MSDVFISYSQGAPEPTERLAEDLKARGYAYWFDTRLLPSDVFWRVIMRRITDSKAVIAIWSPKAVESEWVYSEAKLAHEQKKLICVRTPDVAPMAVPLPFNGYNVSPVTDRPRIYEALERMNVPRGAGGFMVPLDALAAAPVAKEVQHEVNEISIAWETIRLSTDPEDFEDFLRHYGKEHEFFARQAQKRARALRGTAPVIVAPREPEPVAATPSQTASAEIAAAAESVTLRIEAGMHTAMIGRISLSADGRMMATGSDDKTVRLWALPEGRLIRALRPPVGPGNDGKVFAVALAPDASWVAAGGWDVGIQTSEQNYVSIFDTATGAIRTRLGPLPNIVGDLEVSPDGQRLAAGLGLANGIRVWQSSTSPRSTRGEVASWRLAFEDMAYGDNVFGLAFAQDGRLATTSYDGQIRLYASDGSLLAKAMAPGGIQPFGIAFSPDGARLAVGYDDTTRVDVLAADSLALLYAADTSGIGHGNLMSVAWRADGALAAAGRYSEGDRCPILLWQDGSPRRALPGPGNTVTDLASWQDGLAFCAYDPAWGLIGADGSAVLFHSPPLADMRLKLGESFLVSPDGRHVGFGVKYSGEDPWLFDLAGPSFQPSPTPPAGLLQAETKRLSIDGWFNTTSPTLAGNPLPLLPYEGARSLAIAPDGKSFILGAEWTLRRFDDAGKPLWQQPVPGGVWGLNLARDGRLVIAAYGDGTIRWYRADTGAELLAFFVRIPDNPADPKEWVLWTPAGYYTASPGGENLIGWHINRGPDQAADFYEASEFAGTFRKPEVVAKALDGV